MSLLLSEMEAAINDAKVTLNQADKISARMARLLKGRLRMVSNEWDGNTILVELKRELRAFDAHTKQWKDHP